MLNKTKKHVANEYKHRKQTNNLNNSTQEKDKRYKKYVEEIQLQETKTCYACGSKDHLIKSCKMNTNLFVTNEEWPDISEEELKYFLEEYGKISSIKTRRNSFLRRNEALPCYRTAEEAKTVAADINMYQRWTAVMYRSGASKYEQIRVNECYREEQNNAVERSQQKERENTKANKDNVTSSTKEEIENLKKDLKYIKETLKAITSQ